MLAPNTHSLKTKSKPPASLLKKHKDLQRIYLHKIKQPEIQTHLSPSKLTDKKQCIFITPPNIAENLHKNMLSNAGHMQLFSYPIVFFLYSISRRKYQH